MVWPFRRTYPSRAELRVQESWKVGHGEYEGKVIIARFNAGLKEVAGHPEYRYQVGIAVPLRRPTELGLPTPDEDETLAIVEEQIAKMLDDAGESLLAGVLSTGGMREFVFYTGDPAAVREKFDRLQGSISSHELQLMIQEDPKWSVYQRLIWSYRLRCPRVGLARPRARWRGWSHAAVEPWTGPAMAASP
jgi:hypothetical protein